ncbi:hypothetical protein [Streptomyces sp. HC307]|uniref:hypothetical protein n=1 Tax=Streptomyces flavusporus TaxID=3385496 RepID=UPI0039175617
MTPEQIDGLINAWVKVDNAIDTYGPGLFAAAVALATWWALRRAADYRARRRTIRATRRQLQRERQQMARLAAAIQAAPLIPTQPGHDDNLLAQCWNAWNAEPRKENPQP